MGKHEGETTSSLNKRFVSFYYSMPKEIQPLEGVAKLHYVFVFPLELSLFLQETKSITLQRMFVDALEVKVNLRMTRRLLDHGSSNGSDKDLNRVELHEMKETFS